MSAKFRLVGGIRSAVEAMCDQAGWMFLDGYRVPVANATAYWSEVGETLLERYPDALFSATYRDHSNGKRHWSLRSRPNFDVAKIARAHGGDGHICTAGYEAGLMTSSRACAFQVHHKHLEMHYAFEG